jgi:hypothetical protein
VAGIFADARYTVRRCSDRRLKNEVGEELGSGLEWEAAFAAMHRELAGGRGTRMIEEQFGTVVVTSRELLIDYRDDIARETGEALSLKDAATRFAVEWDVKNS